MVQASSRELLAARLVAVVLLSGVYVLFVGTAAGREIDRVLLRRELQLDGSWQLTLRLLSVLLHPIAICLAIIALVVLGFRRARGQEAIRAALVVVGAAVAARALKAVLEELDPLGAENARTIDVGFYPSGHAAVAMAVCLGAILVARDHRRAVAVGGVVWCSVEGFVIVAGPSHHVSDVLGGYLLAIALALVIGVRVGSRADTAPRIERTGLLALAAAPVASVLLVELARSTAISSAQPRAALVFVAAGLAAGAALLVLGFVRLLEAPQPP